MYSSVSEESELHPVGMHVHPLSVGAVSRGTFCGERNSRAGEINKANIGLLQIDCSFNRACNSHMLVFKLRDQTRSHSNACRDDSMLAYVWRYKQVY